MKGKLEKWSHRLCRRVVFNLPALSIATKLLQSSSQSDWPLRNIHISNDNGSFTFYVDVFFSLSLPRLSPDLTVYMRKMYVYFRLFDIKQQSIIIKNTELFSLLLMPLISLVPIVVVKDRKVNGSAWLIFTLEMYICCLMFWTLNMTSCMSKLIYEIKMNDL
jgi:hypothetical protein